MRANLGISEINEKVGVVETKLEGKSGGGVVQIAPFRNLINMIKWFRLNLIDVIEIDLFS